MDPLTALSLAGTIVQFVDFGCKLLAKGRELYKSSTGVLTVNEELELTTTDLRALIEKMQKPFKASSSEICPLFTKEDQESQQRKGGLQYCKVPRFHVFEVIPLLSLHIR